MLGLKVAFKDAEKARVHLMKEGLLDRNLLLEKDSAHIYFPITDKGKFPFPWGYVERRFRKKAGPADWRSELLRRKILGERELSELPSAFDSMGDIAVIELPEKLEGKGRRIAGAFLSTHNHFKVVAAKAGALGGKYRVRKLRVLAGERRLTTIYKESGCAFRIDLGRVYFSPRLSFERERIAKQVRKGEKVLALFAGAGFFPIIIAKKQPRCKLVAIELNPTAVKYMRENVKLNKMEGRIGVIWGDANEILMEKKFRRWATRIIMPLPHSAHEFLPAALSAARKNCIIHFYHIPREGNGMEFESARGRVREACKRKGRKFKVVFQRSVKTYAPHLDEVVVDFKLLN